MDMLERLEELSQLVEDRFKNMVEEHGLSFQREDKYLGAIFDALIGYTFPNGWEFYQKLADSNPELCDEEVARRVGEENIDMRMGAALMVRYCIKASIHARLFKVYRTRLRGERILEFTISGDSVDLTNVYYDDHHRRQGSRLNSL